MLQFRQNDIAATLILTLTELVTLTGPNYLFVFTHVLTKNVVAFVKKEAEDESDFTERYNQFTINATLVFAGKQPGEWHYKIYEQESDTNTDPEAAGGLLEQGKLMLLRASDFEYDMYEEATSFKTYNG